MDYEKKYKEAFERAKECHTDGLSLHQPVKDVIEYIFSELKEESEDERIRKEIISAVNLYCTSYCRGTKVREDMLAWIEKQDPKKLEEQFDKMIEADLSWLEKSTDDKIEPKFNIGDIIFNKKTKEQFIITNRSLALQYYHDEDHLHEVRFTEQNDWEIIKPKFHEGNWVFIEEVDGHKQGPFQIKEITQYGYTFFNERRIIPFECESLMTLWTIADAKDGDVLASELCDSIILFKGIKNNNIDFYCDYDFSEIDVPGDRFSVNNGQHYGNVEDSKDFHPATKEQRDLLFQKMKESGYEWDEKERKLKKLSQQEVTKISDQAKDFEWSEEDEDIFNYLKGLTYSRKDTELAQKAIDWLKSLKGRIQPKLKQKWSEKDTEILNGIANYLFTSTDVSNVEGSDEWYDWLKSLKNRVQKSF